MRPHKLMSVREGSGQVQVILPLRDTICSVYCYRLFRRLSMYKVCHFQAPEPSMTSSIRHTWWNVNGSLLCATY